MTEAVQAAVIRRRIRIPLRFADGYSTTATVVSFVGLADAQQHVALELGRLAAAALPLVRLHSECLTGDVFGSQRCSQVPTALHLTRANAAYLATKAHRGGHDLPSRSFDHAGRPRRPAGPLAGPADIGL